MHYFINAWMEKAGMLPIYAPWCGLEPYWRRGVTVSNYLGENGKNIRKYLYRRSRPNIYHWSNFFLGQCAMPRGPAFIEQYFMWNVASLLGNVPTFYVECSFMVCWGMSIHFMWNAASCYAGECVYIYVTCSFILLWLYWKMSSFYMGSSFILY